MRIRIWRAAVLALAGTCALWAAPKDRPPKRYQEWLSGPVSYLITKPEREAFLRLGTDEERDRFIDRFWDIRNPAPGSPQNAFKEEFYRRLAYVNAHLGRYNGSEGWRSDMGKTYLLFGAPQTNSNYVANQELHPIELWFYANPGLAELPPFFYVLFFERDDISGYRLYQPLTDGPDTLLKAGGTKQQAYSYLRGISPELARASLTLIPGEPIDTETYSGSMESVNIVNAIHGYRDMPSYLSLVQARAARLERVASHIEYDVARTSLVTFVSCEQGEHWLDWQLELNDPLQPKAKAGRVAYDITARLFSRGRLVFERTDAPEFAAPPDLEALKRRPLAYQDRMPVVPGEYRLAVSARNRATGKVYETEKQVTVPVSADRALLSDILVIARHDSDPRPRAFQFSGVKFSPAVAGHVRASGGLLVLYQVMAGEPRPAELTAEYVVGSVSGRFRKVFEDRLDLSRADASGSLLTAKTLPIEELLPGSYQLALQLKDARTGKISARSTSFLVINADQDPAPIYISRSGGDAPRWTAVNQYERALCWLAQNRPLEAVVSLEASWKLNQSPVTKGLLLHLYESTGQKSKTLD